MESDTATTDTATATDTAGLAADGRCGGIESETGAPDDQCTGSGCEGCSVSGGPEPLLLGVALAIAAWLRRPR